jgi:hypothetical protein
MVRNLGIRPIHHEAPTLKRKLDLDYVTNIILNFIAASFPLEQ